MYLVKNSSDKFLNSTMERNVKTIQDFMYRETTRKFILKYDILTAIILILIFLLGSGNLVVLFVIKRTKKLRNAFNIFVVGLAVENILCSYIRVSLELYELFSQYELRSKSWCQVSSLWRFVYHPCILSKRFDENTTRHAQRSVLCVSERICFTFNRPI